MDKKRAFGQVFLHSMKSVARPAGFSLDLGRQDEGFDKLEVLSGEEARVESRAGDLPGLALGDLSSLTPQTQDQASSDESR